MTQQEQTSVHAWLDADLILFRFAIANQDKTGKTNIEKAKDNIAEHIERIESKVFADKTTLVFSDKHNFRKFINRCYKANRQGDKPILFNPLRQWMQDTYPWLSKPNLEADDVLGIVCTSGRPPHEVPVLVSYDKDMRTLPVQIYNQNTDEFEKMTPEEADRVFWTQCITGDTTDGYYGIPGVGPKGAAGLVEEILEKATLEERLAVLKREYEWRYLSEDYMLRQCQMAYILRDGDYRDATGEIRLFGTRTWYSPEVVEL